MSDTRQIVKWQLKIPGLTAEISGKFYLFEYIEEDVSKRLDALGVTHEFRTNFLATDPMPYGWFIGPSLTEEQCRLLKALLLSCMEPKSQFNFGLTEFVAALNVTLNGCGVLTVSLTPPGHVDFGIYTIFCHCPRCKASAGSPPWKSDYPVAPMKCEVCGFEYSPQTTYSSEKYYSFSSLQCLSCYAIVKLTEFVAGDNDLLEEALMLRRLAAELKMVKLVEAFEQQYPGVIKNQLRTNAGKGNASTGVDEDRQWNVDEQRILAHVSTRSFNPTARIRFLTERLTQARTIPESIVICPQCHGPVF